MGKIVRTKRMKVIWTCDAPMHLLELRRVLQDEGFGGGLRFAFNMATNSVLRQRILAMRRLFQKYGGASGCYFPDWTTRAEECITPVFGDSLNIIASAGICGGEDT